MNTRLLIIILCGIVVILTTWIVLQNFAESKELMCLRIYKDINELASSKEMQLAERETIQKQRDLVFEYVEKDCPEFQDLESIYNNYKQNFPVVEGR